MCKSRIDGWSKTGRDAEGETFPVCDSCWEADRSGLVIVAGPVNVTARCDECLELMNPRKLVVRRALKREVYRGTCRACDNRGRK